MSRHESEEQLTRLLLLVLALQRLSSVRWIHFGLVVFQAGRLCTQRHAPPQAETPAHRAPVAAAVACLDSLASFFCWARRLGTRRLVSVSAGGSAVRLHLPVTVGNARAPDNDTPRRRPAVSGRAQVTRSLGAGAPRLHRLSCAQQQPVQKKAFGCVVAPPKHMLCLAPTRVLRVHAVRPQTVLSSVHVRTDTLLRHAGHRGPVRTPP